MGIEKKSKIAIIGAGATGLVAAKELVEVSAGFKVKIFEKKASIGGVFSSSYPNLHLVNNPYLISFSDFLPEFKQENLKMWSAKQYVDYLNDYADSFNLRSCIQFNTQVLAANRQGDQWILEYSQSGETREEVFDYVVVCSGTHMSPNYLNLQGQESFTGDIIHSGEIKSVNQFKDRRVVFVGLGETASDLVSIAVDSAKEVAVSVRRWPGYFIPRYHDGKPTDLDTSMLHHALPRYLDQSMLGFFLRLKRRLENNKIHDPKDKKIQETIEYFNHHFKPIDQCGPFHRITIKNANFISAYLKNPKILYPGIKSILEDEVLFQNNERFKADMIVLCTGYKPKLDFLPTQIAQNFNSNKFYYYMFPLEEKRICFLGFIRPTIGSTPPLSELQSRYLAQILSNRLKLPSIACQQRSIQTFQGLFSQQFPFDFERVPHLVDFYIYATQLAKQIGIMPKQGRLFLQDPLLWYKVNAAVMCPAIFRVHANDPKSKKSKKVIRQLPTVPKNILLVEFLAFLTCKILSPFLLKKNKRLFFKQ